MRMSTEEKEQVRQRFESYLLESTPSPKVEQGKLLIMNNLMALTVCWGAAIAFSHFIKPVIAVPAHANNLLLALFFFMVMMPVCLAFAFFGLRLTVGSPLLSILLPFVVLSLSAVIHTWFTQINLSVNAHQSFGVEIRQFFIFYAEIINPVLGLVAGSSLIAAEQFRFQIFGLAILVTSCALPLFALLGGLQLRKRWLPQERERGVEVSESNWMLAELGISEKITLLIILLIALSASSFVMAVTMMEL